MGLLAVAKLLAVALAISMPASATPVPAEGLTSRNVPIRIMFCKQLDFKGECNVVVVNKGTCGNLPDDFNNQITSIKNLDTDIGKCTWFLDGDCAGDSYGNQDDGNLADGNGKFDDSISSVRC